jgi:hypothetical protein
MNKCLKKISMTRKIAFRAWDKENKKILYYPFWSTLHNKAVLVFEETHEYVDDSDYQDDIDLMQYTGLKDKNGKEIYEGDILDWGGLKPLTIIFKDNGFKAQGFGSDDVIIMNQEGAMAFAKIIGNVFENSNLLKSI